MGVIYVLRNKISTILLETLSGGSDIYYHQFLVLGVVSLSIIIIKLKNSDERKVPTASGLIFFYCVRVSERGIDTIATYLWQVLF